MNRPVFLSDYLKAKFGEKVHKVSFKLGLTCPNRDGRISYGGCIYCNGAELIPFSYREGMTPKEQIEKGIEVVRRKYKVNKFIAYLQDNTGTYGFEDYIMNSISDVLGMEGIVGISIGTRADCISDSFYKFFSEISKKTFLMVELGVQSINPRTLEIINRGHGVKIVEDAFKRLNQSEIHTVAHVIIGLMNDKEDDVKGLAEWISKNEIKGIKVHNIVVLRDTSLEKMYLNGGFVPPEKERLIELYKIFFNNIKSKVVIHRLTTDADKRFIVAPEYAQDKNSLLKDIKLAIGF
ncbi:MAG: TIGR01212 family radical SAM protein [Deltaproteobacteria bacterium]|nr:TIGR01212 family radical SAM protein [Deltaproteobacteria bacterium]